MTFIYVPQGKAARLKRSETNFNITGLYTEQFSTCSYVVLIGPDTIGLMHLDQELPIRQVKEEIESTNPNMILVISRPGNELVTHLQRHLSPIYGVKLQFKQMDTRHNGVHVSFDADGNSGWHPQVHQYALWVRPDAKQLLHHPSEQRIVAVQRIEHVIGLRAIAKGAIPREKTLLIYNNAWQPLSESELKLDDTKPETSEELSFLEENEPLTHFSVRLRRLIEDHQKNKRCAVTSTGADISRMAFMIAPYLEIYVNGYRNEEEIFRRNTKNALDFYSDKAQGEADDQFKIQLTRALDTRDTHDNISLLFRTGEGTFFSHLSDEFQILTEHYNERKSYQRRKEMQRVELTRADELKKSGLSRVLSQGADQTAIDGFSESLKRQCYYGVVDRNMVTTALFLGEALLACGHLDRAESFLRFSLAGCQAAKARDQEERINRKLQECLSASAVSTDSIIPQAAFFTRDPTTNAGAPAPLSPRSTP